MVVYVFVFAFFSIYKLPCQREVSMILIDTFINFMGIFTIKKFTNYVFWVGLL